MNAIIIQKRLVKDQKKADFNITKTFTKLMLLGKLSQASKLINRESGGMLKMDDEVRDLLLQKHPEASPAAEDTLLFGPERKIEEVVIETIDATLVAKVAKLQKALEAQPKLRINAI